MTRFALFIVQLMVYGIVQSLAADAVVVEYTNRAQWEASVGAYTTITFAEIPPNSVLHNQYLSSGIQFSGMNSFTETSIHYPDSHGAVGFGPIHVLLTDGFVTEPRQWISVEYRGGLAFRLYRDSNLIFQSSFFMAPLGGGFAGIVSSVPFDEVQIFDPIDGIVVIDNLYFGIPAPGALAVFGFAALFGGARRRRW